MKPEKKVDKFPGMKLEKKHGKFLWMKDVNQRNVLGIKSVKK